MDDSTLAPGNDVWFRPFGKLLVERGTVEGLGSSGTFLVSAAGANDDERYHAVERDGMRCIGAAALGHMLDDGIIMIRRLEALNGWTAARIKHRLLKKIFGFYEHERDIIVVDTIKARPPSRSPRAWTWPGYTADLTALGILAHEYGHRWHFALSGDERRVRSTWKKLAHGEPATTSYGASKTDEDIAESFRLLVTNPDLLAAVAPKRFQILTSVFGIRIPAAAPWREVLAGSERHIIAAENKIARTPA